MKQVKVRLKRASERSNDNAATNTADRPIDHPDADPASDPPSSSISSSSSSSSSDASDSTSTSTFATAKSDLMTRENKKASASTGPTGPISIPKISLRRRPHPSAHAHASSSAQLGSASDPPEAPSAVQPHSPDHVPSTVMPSDIASPAPDKHRTSSRLALGLTGPRSSPAKGGSHVEHEGESQGPGGAQGSGAVVERPQTRARDVQRRGTIQMPSHAAAGIDTGDVDHPHDLPSARRQSARHKPLADPIPLSTPATASDPNHAQTQTQIIASVEKGVGGAMDEVMEPTPKRARVQIQARTPAEVPSGAETQKESSPGPVVGTPRTRAAALVSVPGETKSPQRRSPRPPAAPAAARPSSPDPDMSQSAKSTKPAPHAPSPRSVPPSASRPQPVPSFLAAPPPAAMMGAGEIQADAMEMLRLREQIRSLTCTHPAFQAIQLENLTKPSLQALRILYQIWTATDRHGRLYAQDFQTLPSPEEFPDYYAQTKRPLSLGDIMQRISDNVYNTVIDFRDDVQLTVANCKRYNQPTSAVYRDALKIAGFLRTGMRELNMTDAITSKSYDPTKLSVLCAELRKRTEKIIADTRDDDRWQAEIFMDLPDRELYPDYYLAILRPLSLNMLLAKLRKKDLTSFDEYVDFIRTLFANAKHFNEEGSQVHEDARIFSDLFEEMIAEFPEELKDISIVQPKPAIGSFVDFEDTSFTDMAYPATNSPFLESMVGQVPNNMMPSEVEAAQLFAASPSTNAMTPLHQSSLSYPGQSHMMPLQNRQVSEMQQQQPHAAFTGQYMPQLQLPTQSIQPSAFGQSMNLNSFMNMPSTISQSQHPPYQAQSPYVAASSLQNSHSTTKTTRRLLSQGPTKVPTICLTCASQSFKLHLSNRHVRSHVVIIPREMTEISISPTLKLEEEHVSVTVQVNDQPPTESADRRWVVPIAAGIENVVEVVWTRKNTDSQTISIEAPAFDEEYQAFRLYISAIA